MRHTKILATIGPATESEAAIQALIEAGVDAIRMNFSHGTADWHQSIYRRIRRAAARADRALAVIQDLQGPKIRLGDLESETVTLDSGADIILTTRAVKGNSQRLTTSYAQLPSELRAGDRVLIDEGRIRLTVMESRADEILCRVDVGGTVAPRKGIHIPGVRAKIPALTEKDKADAALGLSLGVDGIALSFVKRAEDIQCLRAWMQKQGHSVPIIAKIETMEATEHLDEIISAADGVMVARGDLGVETSLALLPFLQKKIIRAANAQGKLVITATQMLESMITQDAPTRAELTDIANSILDGTDVMMLSGETAVGRFPLQCIQQMASTAMATETTLFPFDTPGYCRRSAHAEDLTTAMVRLVRHAAWELKPKAIAVLTNSGQTARLLAAERPQPPIFAFTADAASYQRLAMAWGVRPRLLEKARAGMNFGREMARQLLEQGDLNAEDLLLILLGPNAETNACSSIRIVQAGAIVRE